jgi:hypothetical protein
MRLISSLLLLALPVAGLTAGDLAKVEWKKHVSKAGGYTIKFPFPTKPSNERVPVPTPGGTYKLDHLYENEVDLRHLDRGVYQIAGIHLAENGAIYGVQAWTLTENAAKKKPDQTIALDRDEVANVNGGKLGESKAIKLGKYVGEEYLITVSEKRVIRTWALVNGKSFYLVRVQGTPAAATGADADRFFGSFKINGN